MNELMSRCVPLRVLSSLAVLAGVGLVSSLAASDAVAGDGDAASQAAAETDSGFEQRPLDPLPGFSPDAVMLQLPDVSATHIVFRYANDLWLVPREGGAAKPLAAPYGRDMFPRFSPDGSQVLFISNYKGNLDLYTLPVEGGVPVRVTSHPTVEVPQDWITNPDGSESILFFARGMGDRPQVTNLFTVDPQGGLPQELVVPYGTMSTISPDGKTLAYTPSTRDFRTWKRYVGGRASDIWLFDLENHTSEKITDWWGTDTAPMFVPGGDGRMLYYLSDNGPQERRNLWSYDLQTKQHTQLTEFADDDIRFPAMGPGPRGRGEIVFQAGSHLYLYDIARKTTTQVHVTIPGDRATLAKRRVNFGEYLQGAGISPNGKRVVLEGRGELFSVPVEEGVTRNLSKTDHAAERDGMWSPDGQWIAYLSDDYTRTGDGIVGEYEIFITQSDGRGETIQLTNNAPTHRHMLSWSPDSSKIAFGEHDGSVKYIDIETKEIVTVGVDAWAHWQPAAWSHDSTWIATTFSYHGNGNRQVHLFNTVTRELTAVTDEMFSTHSPVFSPDGDWLYVATSRHFTPTYSSIDRTWVYRDSSVLAAIPLREDVKNPMLPSNEEVQWDTDDNESDSSNSEDADAEGPALPVGVWGGVIVDAGTEEDAEQQPFTVTINLVEEEAAGSEAASQEYAGSIELADEDSRELERIEWDAADNSLTLSWRDDDDRAVVLVVSLEEATEDDAAPVLAGRWIDPSTGTATKVKLTLDEAAEPEAETAQGEDASDEVAEEHEYMEIAIEGFEARAIMLPVAPGNFRVLAVNHQGKLMYMRTSANGGVKMFDISDAEAGEKKVLSTAIDYFTLSADGEKMLAIRGVWAKRRGAGQVAVMNAAPNQTFEAVDMSAMAGEVDPRAEWRQIYTDAWRIYRDWFYDEGMHGVDWRGVFEHYFAMLPDAVNREDVGFLIAETISELNVGHAYYGGGDVEGGPRVNVGMLGVDFELADDEQGNTAYRISRIYDGAPWDINERNPLNDDDVDINEGDFVLEVNGVAIDTTVDPWRAFQGLAGDVVELTVSHKAGVDDDARMVIVELLYSDYELRYRDWIERNRAYVELKSDGKLAYIYVPDTGVPGQNDLVRQFQGQWHKPAMLIDERWNGGGQLPSRFVELLNRPRSNYFGRREGRDWSTPDNAHQGPKAMLVNEFAGSGGDMFPYLFRDAGLGKIIGRRTWGGLVGISGNPTLTDLARISVPRFAFYNKDGTWGVEGWGVDPDYEVMDDPALMIRDGSEPFDIKDPQLDFAIEHLLNELETNAYQHVPKPAGPDRSGIGIPESDK